MSLDLRNPRPWRVAPERVYAFALEVCEEVERLGGDSVWLTERHGFADGYLSQPLTFAAAAAARTKRIRIGTAITLAPLRHPAHLAEEAAVVDLISAGRFDLGLGAGYRPADFDLFGADRNTRYKATEGAVRAVRELWSSGAVTPAPVQDPLPIWLGYKGPQGARRAGRLGVGLLSIDPALVEPYRRGLEEGGHPERSARMAGRVHGWVSEDPERDWPLVSKHLRHQGESYQDVRPEDEGPRKPVDVEDLRASGLAAATSGFLLATPEEAAERLRVRLAGMSVDTVYLCASIAGMSEDVVLRNVRTICTQFAPLVRDL